jgi:hypothetical protein
MTGDDRDTVAELFELIERKAPQYIELLTARDDPEFEHAFDALLERAVDALERNSKNFESLDEEGLSAALVLSISVPGLSATQETNSNGHVDITIVADQCSPARRKLGEAKIWRGAAYHIGGLEQLLTRYTTGREGRGFVISYVRIKGIKDLMDKLREKMDADLPCQQTHACGDHKLKWSFVSQHTHASGELLEVGHIGCNLYVAPIVPIGST